MKFGLSDQDWSTVESLAIKPLKNLGARVYVFGSRATGKHRKFSDLDVLYEVSQKPPIHIVGKIKDDLTESSLPIKVDIVDFDDLAESYRESALRDRTEV